MTPELTDYFPAKEAASVQKFIRITPTCNRLDSTNRKLTGYSDGVLHQLGSVLTNMVLTQGNPPNLTASQVHLCQLIIKTVAEIKIDELRHLIAAQNPNRKPGRRSRPLVNEQKR